MSEVLRDLVVSLSLDGDNFSRNLTSINKQIQEAESEFRRAASGVDNFEKSVSGTQRQLSSLQQKLALQQKAVKQYERALEAANKKLENAYARQGRLTESLDAAKQKNADLKQQVAAATKQYERFSRELGESDSATLAAKANLDALSQEYAESSAEVKKLEGQLAANTKSLQNNADAVTKARTNLNNAQGALRQTEQQIRTNTERLARMQSARTKAGDALTAFGKKCASVSASMEKLGKGMTATLTTPVLALGTAAINASMEYESAFASVRKTVDATEAEYEQLSDAVKKMSTEVATDAADIAEVMANAGQLGIQNDYLVEFTRTMIDLGNSTDIAADEAATAIAQFANITKMSQADFGRFGSALVDLGNNYATTESAIMDMATRLAAAGSQVGLSQAQILGFATALSSVGLEAQAGGTAFSKAMIEMQVAVETNGKSLKDFARVAGLTTEEFKALWNSDPAGAIEKFIVGLSQMDEQGVSSIVTLQEMGFTEVRLRDTLMRATNATELFSEAQQTATSAWEDNVALSSEAGKRYATTESKEFALIQLISDETERQQALDQLNAKYNSDRLAAAQQYAQTLASIIMPVWQQEDIQGAAADIDTLTQKLREYSAADESEKPGILEDLNEITAAMDEGAVTEYIALLMQVQSLLDSGMTEAEVQSLFPELDFSGAMDQIAAIQAFLSDRKNLLPGLESMFSEAIPDEVLKIATDLDMTGAQARWAEFAQNPGAITTEAIISGYGQQEGVEPPKLETVITISGYDLTAYRQFLADNPIEVEGVLRLSEAFQNPEDALKAENVTFWQNGVEIPASLVPKELLTPDKVAVLDEDGTMHILITPKIEGTAESVSAAGEKLDASFVTTSVFGKTSQHDWGALNGLLGGSLIDWMHSFTAELKAFDNYKGSWVTLWGLLDNNTLNGIDKRLNEQFSADNIAGLQTFVSEMVTAIQNGAEVSEEDLQKLQTIVDFLSALELAGVGENITAGIGDAMTAAGWDADAESVAGNLEAALNAAFVIHSPSQRVRPIGENVAAGVGEGMADYDLSADAEALAEKVRAAIETALPADALTTFGTSAAEGLSGALTSYSMAETGNTIATNVKSAVSGSLNASTLRPVGVNAMAGLKAGILAGRSGVISAMRSAARDAVNAAKRELKIKSPSGVFRDEVGRMAMRGFGQGALLESKNQAKVIQNAARYLTGAAQNGIGGTNSYDNRKTYNQNASTTIQVDKLVVRDEQDVRSLAIEIAGLTKRQQRGKGMRFA